uniref:Uncharacterized protein n=1 Tax=Sphaerodactylus townsendi TaxID=933632 RepID=A0ACB8FBP9_9SAUR
MAPDETSGKTEVSLADKIIMYQKPPLFSPSTTTQWPRLEPQSPPESQRADHHLIPVDTRPWKGPRKGFKIDFNGDPNELAFFLIQVSSCMEIHGDGFRSDCDRVFEIGTRLQGEAANWLVGLVEEDAPEIYDLEQFLLALRRRFEDFLAEEKARTALQ